jgi:hypothetical protein
VAVTLRVSVLVIDWTDIGESPPTVRPPKEIRRVFFREMFIMALVLIPSSVPWEWRSTVVVNRLVARETPMEAF